jgi:hypothetical protein
LERALPRVTGQRLTRQARLADEIAQGLPLFKGIAHQRGALFLRACFKNLIF